MLNFFFNILSVTEQKWSGRVQPPKIDERICNICHHLVLSAALQVGCHYYLSFIDWEMEGMTEARHKMGLRFRSHMFSSIIDPSWGPWSSSSILRQFSEKRV